MTPFRAPAEHTRWAEVADLIRDAFAWMETPLGHPARAASVTPARLADAAAEGVALLIEDAGQPVACLFTRPSRDMPDALYLGWLAVARSHRGRDLALTLIDDAENQARAGGFAALTLDTGRVLAGLHAYFRSAGFADIPGEGEIITFRKPLE